MPLIAKKLEDKSKGWYSRVVENANDVATGQRFYRVNTHDDLDALSATGLPEIGSQYKPGAQGNLGNLRVVSRATDYIGGTNVNPEDGGGWTLVTLDYSTRPVVVLGGAEVPYTEWDTSIGEVAQEFSERDDDDEPVEYGYQKEVAEIEVRVHVIRPAGSLLIGDIGPLVSKVNSTSLVLPPLVGIGPQVDIPQKHVRYQGPRIVRPLSGDRIEIIHVLTYVHRRLLEGTQVEVGPEHVVFRKKRIDGTALPSQVKQIYGFANLQPLF